ncbi:unnamed protein product [Amaranthus hypochondriacus]
MGKNKKHKKGNKSQGESSESPIQYPQPPPQPQFPFDLHEFMPRPQGPAPDPSNITLESVLAGFNEIVDEIWDAEKQESKDSQSKGVKKKKTKKKTLSGTSSQVTLASPDATTEPEPEPALGPALTIASTPALGATGTIEIPVETSNQAAMLLRSRDLHSESIFPVYEGFHGLYDQHILTYQSNDFVVHGFDTSQKTILMCKAYDFTLIDWLKTKKNHSHWDTRHTVWNSSEVKKLNQVDDIIGWDCRRLSEDTRLVIESMLKAVMRLHENEEYHGFLHHVENFLFKKEIDQRGGIRTAMLECILVYQNTSAGDKEDGKSIERDLMRLSGVIFDMILEGEELTRELKHLQMLMGDFRNLKANRQLIADHPSIWFWERQFFFYEWVWMKIHHREEQYIEDVSSNFTLFEMSENPKLGFLNDYQETVASSIILMLKSLGDVKDWHANLSEGTLLNRIQKGRFLNEDSYTILGFLRVTHFHYMDKRLIGDKAAPDKYYLLDSDNHDYHNDQFIEVLTSETFPMFLVRVYTGLCGIGVFM